MNIPNKNKCIHKSKKHLIKYPKQQASTTDVSRLLTSHCSALQSINPNDQDINVINSRKRFITKLYKQKSTQLKKINSSTIFQSRTSHKSSRKDIGRNINIGTKKNSQLSLISQFNNIFKQKDQFLQKYHTKKIKKSKIILLSQSIKKYLQKLNQQQLQQQLKSITYLKQQTIQILESTLQNPKSISIKNLGYNLDKQSTTTLSKLLINLQFQILRKYQISQNNLISDLLSIKRNIQYYGRRLKFYSFVLQICFQSGQNYCQRKQYNNAIKQYYKALRLSVFIHDKYHQEVSIDKIGICYYYLGCIDDADYYHHNIHRLPKYEKQLIQDQYSNQQEINQLFKNRFKPNISNENILQDNDISPLNFQNSWQRQNYPMLNLTKIKNQLKIMTKDPQFRIKGQLIKKKILKVTQIGFKKYSGKNYIQHKRSKFKIQKGSTNQVMITHQSFNRIDSQQQKRKIIKNTKELIELIDWLASNGIQNALKATQLNKTDTINQQTNTHI